VQGKQTLRILAALGAAFIALTAAAACGGDDDNDDIVDQAEEEAEEADDDDEEVAEEEGEIEEEVEEEADDNDDDDGVDPCSLLTTEEAEALLEEPVNDPEGDSTTPLFDVCSWTAEAVDSFSIIVLQVLTDEFPAGAEAFYDSTIEGLEGQEFEEISGLGDEAVYYAGLLQVREGDNLIALSVTLQDADEETNKAKTEEAAGIVLDRLD
jgi:hypothetical protein